MEKIGYILSGGFAKGYRTKIISAVAIVGVIASWAVGDMDTSHAFLAILTALGLNTAAAH